MKKILIFLWAVGILYGVSIFVFPLYADKIASVFWVQSWNTHMREFKTTFEETLTSYDLFGKVKDTTDQALELKQNISTNIDETQQKIKTFKPLLLWNSLLSSRFWQFLQLLLFWAFKDMLRKAEMQTDSQLLQI